MARTGLYYNDKEEQTQTTPANDNVESDTTTNEEVITPKENVESPDPQESTEEIDNPYTARLGQIREDIDAAEDAYAKQADEYAKYLEAAKNARENQTSVISGIINAQKPKYDEKREKKLRNLAIVQSLGDMLSAAARGYFAYRKGGAGVVPAVSADSPLKPLENINKMREEYLARDKEWRDLDSTLRLKQSEAEIAAAQALATKAEDDLKREKASVEKHRKSYDEWLAKQIKAEEDAYTEAVKMANQNEQRRLDREAADRRSYASIAAADRRAEKSAEEKKDDDDEWTIEDYQLVDEYRKDHPKMKTITETDEATGEKVKREVPYTQRDYDSQSTATKKEELVRARAEKKRKEVYDELIKMGKTPEQAVSAADDYMKNHYNKKA